MNPKHSAKSADWMTPDSVLEAVREFFGGTITLDAASDEEANRRVKALSYLTDSLIIDWPASKSIFLNPPGGKQGQESLPAAFWNKLAFQMHYGKEKYGHAIFLAFSIEAFQTCQATGFTMLSYPFCVPRKRLQFVSRYAPEIMSHEDFIAALNEAVGCPSDDMWFDAGCDDKAELLSYVAEAEIKDDACAMINARYKSSPTHANAIVYVPGYIDERERFGEIFSRFGAVRL